MFWSFWTKQKAISVLSKHQYEMYNNKVLNTTKVCLGVKVRMQKLRCWAVTGGVRGWQICVSAKVLTMKLKCLLARACQVLSSSQCELLNASIGPDRRNTHTRTHMHAHRHTDKWYAWVRWLMCSAPLVTGLNVSLFSIPFVSICCYLLGLLLSTYLSAHPFYSRSG